MLLVHQAGSVQVGEVVRYTLTYTPSADRILPTPPQLHVKIKNTTAIPLRAAWLHGPYTVHVAAYPSSFNPHRKLEEPERYGVPQYEPMLKPGGSWQAKLTVPEDIRETGARLDGRPVSVHSATSGEGEVRQSVTWIVEITSQILFSTTASVHFEVLVGRDERSLDFGFAAVAGRGHGAPGELKIQQSERARKKARRHGNVQTAGVYSRAVRLVVEDTETLWDKPPLPGTLEHLPPRSNDRKSMEKPPSSENDDVRDQHRPSGRRKKVHLVILTHGLHSNTGADMLFLKESIDASVKQARLEAKQRHEAEQVSWAASTNGDAFNSANQDATTAPLSGSEEDIEDSADFDEEETIVRGFTGNAVKTERGIQFLGKRLAKYILRFTYPDQPFLPVKKPISRQFTDPFKSEADKTERDGPPSHHGSSIHFEETLKQAERLPYKFTSISFVGHSLGGLVQTYAIAYIHKHSPTFFQQIKPVNFICMAAPMLGLSNENPLYVKFALDFGLVGRTGQDLGLTWRPPTIARGGWNAMIGGLGSGQKDTKSKQEDPATKPLLRILPTGPAHIVLRMFRNRTVYSNVVNDGIVPLRTSCLLFLDWRGLGKVDKARRENGLIGTVAEWGWAELTGANAGTLPPNVLAEQYGLGDDSDNEHVRKGEGDTVPQPAEDETTEDNKRSTNLLSYDGEVDGSASPSDGRGDSGGVSPELPKPMQSDSRFFSGLFSFLRPSMPERTKTPPHVSKKTTKALHRGQTIHHSTNIVPNDSESAHDSPLNNPTVRPRLEQRHTGQVHTNRPKATRGDSVVSNETGDLQPPPKTSIFESAGDILHPPLPSLQWITNPSSRTRTIFHDRVYHPDDIPPPPLKRQGSRLSRSFSYDAASKTSQNSSATQGSTDSGTMKVEEKIARAYHRDLSWRKVLVRLEPDAHNNMIVRRMFANAYGWPVIKHLCDTHFADTYAATTRDEDEPAHERAQPMNAPIPETGEEVVDQTAKKAPDRTQSETREARDELAGLEIAREGAGGSYSSNRIKLDRHGSIASTIWDDSYFEGSDGEDDDIDERTLVHRLVHPTALQKPEPVLHRPRSKDSDHTAVSPATPYIDGHRGLAPVSPGALHSPVSLKSSASTMPTLDSAGTNLSVVTDARLTEEPGSMDGSPGGTAALGLRKTIEEQVTPPKAKR